MYREPSVQTLRRLRGRQPLCACGVTSRTPVTSRPAACRERIAVSRPEPGPFTKTSTFCMPCSMPLRAAASAVTCAAKGVDLREPLKPAPPADSHAMTLPSRSVSATIVLLKLVLMCAWPIGTFLRTLRRPRWGRRGAGISYLRGPSRPALDADPRNPASCDRSLRSLLRRLLLAGHGHPLRALSRARVRLGVLAAHGQPAAVAHAAVGADLHQALDVLGALAAQIALDREVVVDRVTELGHLVLGEVADVGVRRDADLREQLVGGRAAHPVDVGETDLDALVERDVDPGDTSHLPPSPAAACGGDSSRPRGPGRYAG